MNLVIKGADFSSVSIGKVDMKIARSAGLGACMVSNTNGKLEYLSISDDYLVNVYKIPSYVKKLNMNVKGSGSRPSYSFCYGTMPTTEGGAVENQNASSVLALNDGFEVVEKGAVYGSNVMHLYENVDVPNGAEFVIVYAGADAPDKASTYVEIVL